MHSISISIILITISLHGIIGPNINLHTSVRFLIIFGLFIAIIGDLITMAEWLRAWDTFAMMKLWRREVVSSIPDRGTIVG